MRKQEGFSLIELLIVVAIILIIAAIAIPSLIRARVSANESAAAANTRTIITAEIQYHTSFAVYSPDLTSMGTPSSGCTTAGVPPSAIVLTWPAYIAGFTLQSTTNLVSPASWSTNSPAPVLIGDQNTVTNAITAPQQFYRLSH